VPPLVIGGLLGFSMSLLTGQLVTLTQKWSTATRNQVASAD